MMLPVGLGARQILGQVRVQECRRMDLKYRNKCWISQKWSVRSYLSQSITANQLELQLSGWSHLFHSILESWFTFNLSIG